MDVDYLYLTPTQYTFDCELQRKRAYLEQEIWTTQTFSGPSDKQPLIAVYGEMFRLHITKRWGRVQNCYIAEVTGSYSRMKSLDDIK